jgi:hypothetical protein
MKAAAMQMVEKKVCAQRPYRSGATAPRDGFVLLEKYYGGVFLIIPEFSCSYFTN